MIEADRLMVDLQMAMKDMVEAAQVVMLMADMCKEEEVDSADKRMLMMVDTQAVLKGMEVLEMVDMQVDIQEGMDLAEGVGWGRQVKVEAKAGVKVVLSQVQEREASAKDKAAMAMEAMIVLMERAQVWSKEQPARQWL